MKSCPKINLVEILLFTNTVTYLGSAKAEWRFQIECLGFIVSTPLGDFSLRCHQRWRRICRVDQYFAEAEGED